MERRTSNIIKKLMETGSKSNEEKLGKDEVHFKCIDLKDELMNAIFSDYELEKSCESRDDFSDYYNGLIDYVVEKKLVDLNIGQRWMLSGFFNGLLAKYNESIKEKVKELSEKLGEED